MVKLYTLSKNFSGALNSEKLTGINFEWQGDYVKEN